jgi:hypothetical protein
VAIKRLKRGISRSVFAFGERADYFVKIKIRAAYPWLTGRNTAGAFSTWMPSLTSLLNLLEPEIEFQGTRI